MSWVHEFGAVGDGKTDDTRAIQHAADTGAGVLAFAKGTYRITRPIVLDTTKQGFVGLRGDQGTARVRMDGPGPAFKLIGDHRGTAQPSTVKEHTWNRERFPVLSGLEIVGNHEQADGIQLFRTMQTTIQNMAIRKCRFGVHLVERNRNLILADSHIYDCSDTGLFFDRCNLHQVIVTGNHISYCRRAGIRQWNGDVHNVQITGNDIEYNSGADGTTGEVVLEAPDGIISEYIIGNNTLQATREARDANILIIGRADTPPAAARAITISGNVIGSRTHNIIIKHATRVSITGNYIYDGTRWNVALVHCTNSVLSSGPIATRPADWNSRSTDGVVLDNCQGCTLIGLALSDCKLGESTSGGSITLRGCSHCAVSSCQSLNPHICGIALHDCRRCRISDNTVDQPDAPGRMVSAISVTGDSRENVIQNNTVCRGTAGAILCDKKQGAVIGNTVW